MKLYFSPTSPFSRKARIAAALAGVDDRIELVRADTNNPTDVLRVKNPLGKILTLEREDGPCIYDSAVICAYLDELAGGGRVIPAEREARFAALTLEALADGVADAAILQIYEKRMRAESEYSENWIAHQRGKIDRAMASLEASRRNPAQAISARSPSPVRWAISTCVSTAPGAPAIRASSPGSTPSWRRFRPSTRPGRKKAPAQDAGASEEAWEHRLCRAPSAGLAPFFADFRTCSSRRRAACSHWRSRS